MKFLIDMNLSPLWVRFLAEKGFDSVHWSTIGRPPAPDTQTMEYAAANQMIVGALLVNGKSSQPSAVQVRPQDILPAAIGDIVLRALHASRSQLEDGPS